MNEIRTLKAEEIDVRVGVVKKNGVSLLLYKDARCDMKILDETFGITGWQRSHEEINGQIYCTVSVYDHIKKEWISKEDVGTESNSEKEKGAASDSFKRACVNFGIGRELYTAPFIWIGSDMVDIKPKNGGNGYTTYDRFVCLDIGYNENREICTLVIAKTSRTGGGVVPVFRMGNSFK